LVNHIGQHALKRNASLHALRDELAQLSLLTLEIAVTMAIGHGP
jgi:hypothetical protein